MNVLFDTNVVLDVLLDRVPFSEAASQLFAYVEYQRITGYLCSTGASRAKDEIRKLLQLFRIAPVDKHVLEAAVANDFTDFEDGVLYEAARYAGADTIVTRNEHDFTHAKLTIYPPPDLVNVLRSTAS